MKRIVWNRNTINVRRGSAASLTLIVIALLIIGAVVGVVAWMSFIRNPSQEYLQQSDEQLIKLTGLGQPVSNSMSDRYTDANGDLIADPPADAAKLIDPPTLYFSYVPVDDSTDFKTAFGDLMKYITRETGKPCEYVEFESVEAQLKAMRDGKLHVAGLNTGGVPMAVNAAGFVPVSLLAGDETQGYYKMQIIARADSSIKSLSDLKGKELALTDASSNSGYKAPLVLLQDHGLRPGRDYTLRYTGGQDNSIAAIASKEYEVAAVASDVLKREIGAGRIKAEDFRVVHESGQFPSAALGYAYNLKPELAAKLRECLTKFDWKDSSMATYFANAGQTHFAPADYKKDWELVRRIDNEIGYAHKLPE